MPKRIFLSPPHMSGEEIQFVNEAFASNYIAPLGPQVDAFENEFAQVVGTEHAAAISSGTAALHLALRYIGIKQDDEVFCSSLTFVASVNPVLYLGAKPVFIDSERQSWNMDPELLIGGIQKRAKKNKLPKAVILVHLYGQSADIDPILDICQHYEIPLIEDAAEALGATYKGSTPGSFGTAGIYSFNGNKIITTSGGGMLVSNDKKLIEKSRFWATQARDNAAHYEHSEIGYNYRMSNILAAIGRGQLKVLRDRVNAKRWIFDYYKKAFEGITGINFMPEADYGRCTRWLTCATFDSDLFGATAETIRLALEAENIESRPVWKPMHLQPLFSGCEMIGGSVSQELFQTGLCLPSGTMMEKTDIDRVISIILSCHKTITRKTPHS